MTEKRFEYYEHKGADYILDTPNKSLDFIEMLGDCLEAEEIVDLLNQLYDENEKLKQQLKLKEVEERINCRKCIYFISGSSSDSCLKREDIGYKGTCIDGMDYHYLAKNCPYY